MGQTRKGLRTRSAAIGFAAASFFFLGQAGAAHAPAMTAAVPQTAAATLPATAETPGRNAPAFQPLKNLKVNVSPAALRMAPELGDGTYTRLAVGPIRYPDGALKLPGRIEPVMAKPESPEVLEVGHGVSTPSAIIVAEGFNAYTPDAGKGRGGHDAFADLPLVSTAHAASEGPAMDAMGGPLTRMPIGGHIIFEEDGDALPSETREQLDRLVETLREGHAALEVVAYGGRRDSRSSDARRLSLRRGLAVRSYLVSRGIDQKRISVLPMGGVRDDGPKDRVDVFYASY